MTTITELSAQAGRPTITELPVDLGFEAPTEREFKALVKIVQAAHAPTRKFADETEDAGRQLWHAFAAVGYLWRRAAPDTSRYFDSHVEDVNAVLKSRWMARQVDGRAVMAAIIAHNDIPYRLGDRRVGQPLEVALDPHAGFNCSNAWRAVLQGAPLRSPLPPRDIFRQSAGPSPIPVFQETGLGSSNRSAPTRICTTPIRDHEDRGLLTENAALRRPAA
jgi:hypothetical protein